MVDLRRRPRLHLIFGGTFDPPHNGHLSLARAAANTFGVPVWWLPNGRPRHRGGPRVDAATRADLIALAIADEPNQRLDRRELAADISGFSVDTLEALRRELGPEQPIAWLLGADSFRSLNQWHRWERLGELTHFIVVERPGEALDDLVPELGAWVVERWRERPEALFTAPAGLLYRLPFTPRGESATAIRQRLANGDHCLDVLPAAVAGAICERGLYRTGKLG